MNRKTGFFFAGALFTFQVLLAGPDAPDLIEFEFSEKETRVLPGTSTEKNRGPSCNGVIKPVDRIGALALVSKFYQNDCYTGTAYAQSDFKVERGLLKSGAGDFDAYRVHPSAKAPTKFLASNHVVYYKFENLADHVVYKFDRGALYQVAKVGARAVRPGAFTKIPELVTGRIAEPTVFVFAPAGARLSPFTEFAPGVEGANVHRSGLGRVDLYRYGVAGTPFDTRADFRAGPDSHQAVYGHKREFFLVKHTDGYPGVVWQDRKSGRMKLTWIPNHKEPPRTANLPGLAGARLAAATNDEAGFLYYIMIQKEAHRKTARQVGVYKTTSAGRSVKTGRLDAGKRGLNMVSFAANSQAALAHANGKLGLILSRTMHKSSDGLNHQGAIAVVLNAATLGLVKNLGQTSGHSFSNVLTTTPEGDFLGIDLGDNYPRGVHLHRFGANFRHSKIVFTFKTAHGTSARSPAGRTYPRYSEISGRGKTFYKWSNDNRTYSELGGVVAGEKGTSVIFAAESKSGRALDNSRATGALNDSRNIGLVRVISNFESIRGPTNVVSDRLMVKPGGAEEGGFYDFGGGWNEQRNTGVVWLTRYANPKKENATRVKTARLNDGSILILWERWTDREYGNTYAMRVRPDGKKIKGPEEIGSHVRLGWRDDPLVIGDTVYLAGGNKVEGKLELVALRVR